MKEFKPKNSKREIFFRKAGNYILLSALLLLLLSVFRNITNIRQVEQKISDKENEVDKIRKEQEELQKKLEFAQSSDYIEKQLRDRLGLVKEGEIVVVLPPPEVLRKFAPKIDEEEEFLPDPNWKKWLKLFI